MNTPHTPPAVSCGCPDCQGNLVYPCLNIAKDGHRFYLETDTGGENNQGEAVAWIFNTLKNESERNARRLVECWNACQSMADPAAEIASLRAQRDELLKALEHLEAELHKALDDVPAGVDAWMSQARIAIANATRQ